MARARDLPPLSADQRWRVTVVTRWFGFGPKTYRLDPVGTYGRQPETGDVLQARPHDTFDAGLK